jgi:hypothetical protein
LYREAVITLATRGGQDVPAFLRVDGVGLNEVQEGDVERLREWLASVVSMSQAAPGRARASIRSGGRSGRGGSGGRRHGRREAVAESDVDA